MSKRLSPVAIPFLFVAALLLHPGAVFGAGSKPLEVEFKNAKGEAVGTARISEADEGVKIKLDLNNISPGMHAFHVHENGKCEPPKFESAGGHYNPTGAHHGFKAEKGPHAGDFENIRINDDGTLKIEVVSKRLSLTEGEAALRKAGGTALVIHEGVDDYKSQPSGDAGGRFACAVIPAKDPKN